MRVFPIGKDTRCGLSGKSTHRWRVTRISGMTTARFNVDPSNVQKARKAEGTSALSDWFDGGTDAEMNEDVVGLGSYGKTLTVLFTDEPFEDDD